MFAAVLAAALTQPVPPPEVAAPVPPPPPAATPDQPPPVPPQPGSDPWLIPSPRLAGFELPPAPPPMAVPSGVRPEAILGWCHNLSSPDAAARDAAEEALKGAGWDGFRAARTVAATSECPEARGRAARVCEAYLSVGPTRPSRSHPAVNSYPPISGIAGNYRYGPEAAGGGSDHVIALVVYQYTLKAIRAEWEANRADPSRANVPFWTYSAPEYRKPAMRLLCRDLLACGFSREWVRWLLDYADQPGRVYWPQCMHNPPRWLLRFNGVEPDGYFR